MGPQMDGPVRRGVLWSTMSPYGVRRFSPPMTIMLIKSSCHRVLISSKLGSDRPQLRCCLLMRSMSVCHLLTSPPPPPPPPPLLLLSGLATNPKSIFCIPPSSLPSPPVAPSYLSTLASSIS
ncbi:uncharacterized protein BO66DRAFT_87881 [Aspergillus aculeatinus CBS 121060]|uniref:Uncharacterized protein n=1 Tax=Aspergillus aculeatinus CBS 121060 TaxID=1448322 RepID=A0ACD1H8L5_9EURO|nr:hypothetical protein BO66DRAFT_87881 [Aspergillus aculeatinus CBS 121060]RAH70100.1 hypothetical protein BO66DRAFT_87881 [Aspergillus aculeatinus CBS 121060]